MPVELKRVYEPAAHGDGYRVLVDRLWPRGLKRDDVAFDEWPKEIAPSGELRRWYGHRPERWEEFREKYREELTNQAAQNILDALASRAFDGTLTLLYAARGEEHTHAAVLRELLEARLAYLQEGQAHTPPEK